MAENEVLQWFGGIVAALWIAFFGMQQRKINQMVSREEIDELVENVEKTFTMRRETVEQRLDEHDRRFEHVREDLHATEKRLIDELRASEARLSAIFWAKNREER